MLTLLCALPHQIVQFFHAQADRFGRIVLQVQIECRIDAIGVVLEVVLLKLLEERIIYEIDEVGSIGRLRAAFGHDQRLFDCAGILLVRDVVVLAHQVQNHVPPGSSALRPADGVREAGTLDQPRQRRNLGQRKISNVLTEIGLRGLTEATNRKAAAPPQVDLLE